MSRRSLAALLSSAVCFRPLLLPVLCLLLSGLWRPSPALAQNSPGHVHWDISVTYDGTATFESNTNPANPPPPQHPIGYIYTLQGLQFLPLNGQVDLSTASNSPLSTDTGGITGLFQAGALVYNNMNPDNEQTGRLSLGSAHMNFTLTWRPKNDDLTLDPAPHYVYVLYPDMR